MPGFLRPRAAQTALVVSQINSLLAFGVSVGFVNGKRKIRQYWQARCPPSISQTKLSFFFIIDFSWPIFRALPPGSSVFPPQDFIRALKQNLDFHVGKYSRAIMFLLFRPVPNHLRGCVLGGTEIFKQIS